MVSAFTRRSWELVRAQLDLLPMDIKIPSNGGAKPLNASSVLNESTNKRKLVESSGQNGNHIFSNMTFPNAYANLPIVSVPLFMHMSLPYMAAAASIASGYSGVEHNTLLGGVGDPNQAGALFSPGVGPGSGMRLPYGGRGRGRFPVTNGGRWRMAQTGRTGSRAFHR